MKVYEIINEDGRIVKGVNTTPDVDTNEIKTQAAKFGNTVDKDGRPPTLSKKVKGKTTNVLFNLGLTEGVMLKFQRGEDFDTLHIKPKGKNRVELRGKPGYERGNYDAQDKLHQVLDNLGKAANFAELMNGETVSINPNHPDGERANKTAQDILSTEAWSEKYKRSIDCSNPKGFSQKSHCAGRKKNEARTPRMNPADIAADTIASSQPLSQEELQSLVNDYRAKPPRAVANLLNRFDVDKVINIAMMIGAPHLSFLQRFLIRQGINFSKRTMRQALAQVESIEENFADGKKKGKSRPGRVKRAGASCNGSVTDLRKRAKNASGEKAKMYHWCANMKSGRKKK